MEDIKDIEKLIKDIDKSMKEITDEKPQIQRVPTNLEILFSGVSDQIGIQTLFSDKVDGMIGKLFDSIMSGNYYNVLSSVDKFGGILDKAGIKSGEAFEGELSQRIVNTVSNSVSSAKFNKTRSGMKKCLIVIRDLNKDANSEKDPGKKKKLKDAIYAIKQVLRIVAKIYKMRKRITARVKRGLNTIVNEGTVNEVLIQSASDEAFEKNIKTEIAAGKPQKQAVAIAYSVKEKNLKEEWNISDFKTAEELGRELGRLHAEKEKHLKADDMPSAYFENIDSHIKKVTEKMNKFKCKCEKITEAVKRQHPGQLSMFDDNGEIKKAPKEEKKVDGWSREALENSWEDKEELYNYKSRKR